MSRRLLVVHHAPTPAVRLLVQSVLAGAGDDAIEGVEVVARAAPQATAADVQDSDGVLLVTPANFGYMAGMLKDFFDRTFLEIGGALGDDGGAGDGAGSSAKKPYGLAVHGRYDTTGAVRSVEAIVAALPWRQAAPVLEALGDVDDAARERAYELGGTLAALLMEG